MQRTSYLLAVVIINYRTPRLTVNCLETLIPELNELSAKVIVVDNASQDNSCTYIEDWIKQNDSLGKIDLIASTANTGFSGGNNLGIGHVDADFYLLLNSDTLVRKGAIPLLLDAALNDKQAGLVSPRLEWQDTIPQESCFKFHTPMSELISSAATGPVTRLFRSYIVPQPVSERPGYYDWTSFACVMIKADVFKAIGLMDEGYFMFYEDVAFAYRAQRAGWKVLNVPQAHVVHLRGGSSPVKSQTQLRKRLPRYYYESRTRYFYQLYGHSGLLVANLLWSLGWGISLLRQLVSSSFRSPVSEAQWRDIWINFFNPLKPYVHPDDYDET